MISKAILRFARVAPRKVRQIIPLVKGENVNKALAILQNTNKAATKTLSNLINSAIGNAKRNPSINVDDLFISKLQADEGPMLKRYKAQAMGRATMVRKKMSHITVELDVAEKKIKQQVVPEIKKRKGVAQKKR